MFFCINCCDLRLDGDVQIENHAPTAQSEGFFVLIVVISDLIVQFRHGIMCLWHCKSGFSVFIVVVSDLMGEFR